MHHSMHLYLNIQCIKSLWFANKRKRPNQECHCGHLSHPGKEVPDVTEEDGGPAADQIGTRIIFCWDTWQTTPQQSISESQASMESTGLESMSLPSRTWTQGMPCLAKQPHRQSWGPGGVRLQSSLNVQKMSGERGIKGMP